MKRPAGAERFGELWDRLYAPPIAHRGYWSAPDAPPNSLAAFQAACAAGYGIELDVHLSADGEAMVFHDETLEAMTGVAGRLADHTAAELGRMRLAGSEETIPTLAEVLTLVGHRALVLIELKTPWGEVGPLERRVCDVLIDHNGPTAIIGFNPYSHAWFAEHRPDILRGLDSHRYRWRDAPHLAEEKRRAFARLQHVATAKPHFLALSCDMLDTPAARRLRARGMPVVAWTVRSAAEQARLAPLADNVIFEGFAP